MGDSLNILANAATWKLTTVQQKERLIKQGQHRLLLLRHSCKCTRPEGNCRVEHCDEFRKLWKHIAPCRDAKCSVPYCVASRNLLKHYYRCKNDKCLLCLPVRKLIKQDDLKRKQEEEMVSKKRQKR